MPATSAPEPPTPAYPPQAFAVAVQPRFGDMDSYGHINNVSVLRIVEESRVRMLAAQADWGGFRMLVARQEAEYRAILHYGVADIQVHIWASRIGNSSFELCYAVEDGNGQTTALAATTVVVIDDENRPAPIPERTRAGLEKLSGPAISFRGR